MFIKSTKMTRAVLLAGLFCAMSPLVARSLKETRTEAEKGNAYAQHAMGLRCA